MKKPGRIRKTMKALLVAAAGGVAGCFWGSALPAPPYIEELRWVPVEMNSSLDVSFTVKSNLPKDVYEAFEVAAGSSSRIAMRKGTGCGCTWIYLERAVARLPLPDRELTIYFALKDGELTYEGATLAKWFL